MKTDTIKISFAASILFHSIVIYIFASHFSPVKDTVMNITPIEILNIEDKNPSGQIENKMEDTPPPLPEKEIHKIKEEIPPQVETVKHEINNIVEAPPIIEEIASQNLEQASEKIEDVLPDEVVEPQSNELFVKTETEASNNAPHSSAESNPDPASSEVANTVGSKYGVAGGIGSGNGEEMSMFRAMVRTKIERSKFYPRWARERGFEGVVGVRFVVNPDGGVSDVTIVRPCHCEVLNKAACEAIMKAAPFNPRPVDVADREMAMEVDISYRLD